MNEKVLIENFFKGHDIWNGLTTYAEVTGKSCKTVKNEFMNYVLTRVTGEYKYYIIACRGLILQSEGHTIKEVCEKLGVSRGTLDRYLRLARNIPPNKYDPNISIIKYLKRIEQSPAAYNMCSLQKYNQQSADYHWYFKPHAPRTPEIHDLSQTKKIEYYVDALKVKELSHFSIRDIAKTTGFSETKVRFLLRVAEIDKKIILNPKITTADLREAILTRHGSPNEYLKKIIDKDFLYPYNEVPSYKVPKEEEYPTALHKKLEVIISKIKDMERENASLQEENQVLRKQLERIKGTVNDLLELAV